MMTTTPSADQQSAAATTWRLIHTRGRDGAYNMALDHSIVEQVGAGNMPPTLRLYDWQPACLTLGYAQPAADVDRAQLRAHGWDLTRRITGGRAILHTDEITYSVAFPADHPVVAGDIVTSYRRLSAALMRALEMLGVQATADKKAAGVPDHKGAVCFEVPSHYEITADGKKLIGSAQVRKYGGVLQHGSFPLYGDIARICTALAFDSDTQRTAAAVRVRERATTLEPVLGRVITWEAAAQRIAAAFAATFGVSIRAPEAPAPAELARADELRATVYATEAWIGRVRA